jgi:antitoxin (DNA-binding transcriptional repressor) of toxin-antitoxin stability system
MADPAKALEQRIKTNPWEVFEHLVTPAQIAHGIYLRKLHAERQRRAASKERIVITDDGQPIATLISPEPASSRKRLPDRETQIKRRSWIEVDSADYISEMRG